MFFACNVGRMANNALKKSTAFHRAFFSLDLGHSRAYRCENLLTINFLSKGRVVRFLFCVLGNITTFFLYLVFIFSGNEH